MSLDYHSFTGRNISKPAIEKPHNAVVSALLQPSVRRAIIQLTSGQ